VCDPQWSVNRGEIAGATLMMRHSGRATGGKGRGGTAVAGAGATGTGRSVRSGTRWVCNVDQGFDVDLPSGLDP